MGQKLIAVVGATGSQGRGVVRALGELGGFRVRALTRKPELHADLSDEVVEADLTRTETLPGAFAGAYGVFLVTNFWEPGTDEVSQATAAIEAAKLAGVEHLVWSTLPNVEAISSDRFSVPHYTGKAKVDALVRDVGFPHTTFVQAPFYFQNFAGAMAPQPLPDGASGWTLPIDVDARVVHMGDVSDLGAVVAGAFAHPDQAGDGEVLAMSGGLLSFGDVVGTLNSQGHQVVFQQVPGEVFADFFPGAREIVSMMGYWQEYTYFGPDADTKIALANKITTRMPVDFATWARAGMPVSSER